MEANTKYIPPCEWDRYKETIVSLRRSGIILDGEEGIVAIMKRDHGFEARSSQYELQFSKWEERKNLRANEWRQLFRKLDQYSEAGEVYDVYKHGQPIPRHTLKRKRKEYCKEHEHNKRRQVRGVDSALPTFIEFRTPSLASEAREVRQFDDHQDPTDGNYSIAPSIIEPTTDATTHDMTEISRYEVIDLLSSRLTVASGTSPPQSTAPSNAALIGTHHTQSLEPVFPWTISDASTEAFPFDVDPPISIQQQLNFADDGINDEVETGVSVTGLSYATDCLESDYFSAFDQRPASRTAFLDTPPRTMLNFDWIDMWTSRIPFLQFEEHLKFQGMAPIHGTEMLGLTSNGQAGNMYPNGVHAACVQQSVDSWQRNLMPLEHAVESGNSPEDVFLTHARSVFVKGDPSTSSDTLSHAEAFKSNLLSLLPPDAAPSVLNCPTTTEHPAFPSPVHRSLVFSISNNFAGVQDAFRGPLLNYLANDPYSHFRLMKYLRANPTCVSKALAEKLIQAAIEDCNATMVTALLSTGSAEANEIVCFVKGNRYTAAERSVMLESIEVTRALLVAGANVNTCFSRAPLDCAISRPNQIRGPETEPVDIQMVNLLLKYGSQVRPDYLARAASSKDWILFKMLMSKFSTSQRHDYLQANYEFPQFIRHAVKSLDHDSATSLVRDMLQSCTQTGCGECLKSSTDLRASTSIAALRGFSKIINLVVDYVPKEYLPLAQALRCGQQDIVQLLLEHGADVDPPASKLAEDGPNRFFAYTPLAEAIRGGNNRLIQDFEKRGALSNISEEGRFRAAIYAAAESKNIAYVQKLLREVPDISEDAMDLALEISIKEGYEELALLLLKAGANVNLYLIPPDEKDGREYKDEIASLLALRQKNEILVRAVMDCNMKVRGRLYEHFDSPLLLAARWGNLSIIRGLLSKGADVDGDGRIDDVRHKNQNPHIEDDEDDDFIDIDRSNPYYRETAITAAVKRNNKLLVELLVIKHRASLNLFSDRKTSPLAAAISNKDVNMFRYLLELGADPACHSAFRRAISEDKEFFPELLRAFDSKYPAGKVGFGSAPLRIAIIHNDEEVLDALLEAKLDVNAFTIVGSKGINALGTAIRKYGRQRSEIFEKLISAGSDPNGVVATASGKGSWASQAKQASSPTTALLEAISTENIALVELLVKFGAETDRAAQSGIKRTPLQHACEIGSLEIVNFLLERGVDVNEEPAFRGGGTSLQLCAIAGHPVIAEKLLKLGANVHAARPDMRGRTALEGAAEHGRLDMLKILWYATGNTGFDPAQVACAMELAEKNGHFACRDLIQQLHFMSQACVMPNLIDF